jgi:flagellar biosynthesis anti-sigma factor FlgM
MKIENSRADRLNPALSGSAHPVDKDRRADPDAPAGGNAGADKVAFSDRALSLAKARSAYEAAPEVHSTNFEEVRQDVESGTYQVSHASLAKRLLALFRALPNPFGSEEPHDGI